jgi:hypothetical protein
MSASWCSARLPSSTRTAPPPSAAPLTCRLTLTVGTAAAGTQYAGSVDAKTAGRVRPTFSAAQLAAMDDIDTNTSVVATITPVGATSAGQVRVTLVYVQTAGI